MKIHELVEAIGTIGSTTDLVHSDGLPKTGTNPAPNNAQPNQNKKPGQPDQAFDPAQLAQVKSNLNNLKDPIKAANGGQDFDSSVLAKTLTDPNAMASNNLNPMAAKALKAMMPALGAAEKNPSIANNLKSVFATAASSQQKNKQAAANQQNAQTPVKV
jgi:hypothetical protein